MAASIRLRVLTDEGLALEDEAVSVIAPGEGGSVGFLRHHAPLITTLAPGKLTWRRSDGRLRTAQLGAGFLEVLHDRLTVLTDRFAEPASPPTRQTPG